jgi:tRNA threonylcarbamoyladenosine biosynthesis protein TsaB
MSAPPLPEPCTPEPPEAVHGVPAGAPRLLVFDSSTELLALAVNGPGGAFSLTVAGGAAASATLLPQALRLLQRAGLTLQQLQAVGFGSGPGAFTGLRTACAVAQGLGLGLGVPLLPVDSLLVVAEDARLQWAQRDPATAALEVAVVMDARMQEVYGGRYRWHDAAPPADPPQELPVGEARQRPPGERHCPPPGQWQTLQSPQLYKLPDLMQAWGALPQKTLLAGSALAVFAEQLAPLAAAHCVPVERNRAAALLHLALRAWAAGQGVDAAQALPLYVRDKVAQTTQERDRARDTAAAAADAERAAPATAGNAGAP